MCSLMGDWIKKLYISICNRLFSHKKEGNVVICNMMDEPQGHYEISQTEKAKYHMTRLIYGIFKHTPA